MALDTATKYGGYVGGVRLIRLGIRAPECPYLQNPAPTTGRVRVCQQCVATEESPPSPCASGCDQNAVCTSGHLMYVVRGACHLKRGRADSGAGGVNPLASEN